MRVELADGTIKRFRSLEEAWDQFADHDEWVTYPKRRLIVSQVATDVDCALEALKEHGVIVTEQGRGFALAPW